MIQHVMTPDFLTSDLRPASPIFRFGVLYAMCVVLGCTNQATTDAPAVNEEGLVKVSIALNWLPEIEHGGFYAAKLNGHYESAGLDVEILPGGPDAPVIERVGSERVMFGVSNADRVILGRAGGADVVAVMAALQHSPRCILVHEKSGIQAFDDVRSLTLAMSEKAAFSHFLRHHFPFEDVRIVPYGGSVGQFLVNDNFAQQGYVFSEPLIAEREGAAVRTLMVSDAGFDPYSSLVIANGETIANQSELVQKFVRASIQGWDDYLSSPKKINDHIHSLNPEIDREVLSAGMPALIRLCRVADSTEEGDASSEKLSTGQMSQRRWVELVEQLEEIGLVKENEVDPNEAFRQDFLSPHGD